MVKDRRKHGGKTPVKQGPENVSSGPNRVGASRPYDFSGRNLPPYGGLLPVPTLREKLAFQSLVEQMLRSKRMTRTMSLYQFVLAILLDPYLGFQRVNQVCFIARDSILTGILTVTQPPVQSTFGRFGKSLHLDVARSILAIVRTMRERVWAAANVKLETITLDTGATLHTLYARQMGGCTGDRPTGKQIGGHLRNLFAVLPPGVKKTFFRAGSGFDCWAAVGAYEQTGCQFVIVAGKTPRLVEQLRQAEWKPSPKTDAEADCEFRYQPEGWRPIPGAALM